MRSNVRAGDFMHRLNKIALKAATAVALACSAAVFTTTQASAQFSLEGIIRGAMSRGCCGSGSYSRHHRGRIHESRHHRESKDDEADDDDSKGKDTGTKSADNKTDMRPANSVKVDAAPKQEPQAVASNPSPSTPSKADTYIPAFTPSR